MRVAIAGLSEYSKPTFHIFAHIEMHEELVKDSLTDEGVQSTVLRQSSNIPHHHWLALGQKQTDPKQQITTCTKQWMRHQSSGQKDAEVCFYGLSLDVLGIMLA